MGLGPIKHVVLFCFKDGIGDAKKHELIEAYKGLTHKIPEMQHFEWGVDVSVEGLNQSFTHCFITTFADASARDTYIPHEAHQEYVKALLPHVEKLLVLDYFPEMVK